MNFIEKQDALDEVAISVAKCKKCVLHSKRINTVPGCGNPDSPIVFCGIGPGQEEDEKGLPFVGRSGKLLTSTLEECGFTRDEVYILNLVRCRPPENRNPFPDEIRCCYPYLIQQLDIISPQIIVTLGSLPAEVLLEMKVQITKIRGKTFKFEKLMNDIVVMPAYHPSYVIRGQNDIDLGSGISRVDTFKMDIKKALQSIKER